MASTYSQLKIELIGTGDQAGTWGNTTNTNLGTAIEEAITGSANVTFASSNVALALTDTNLTQTARNLRLFLTGSVVQAQHLFVPAIEKQYIIDNGLTFPITVANGSNSGVTGATITIPAGLSAIVYNDGVNIDNPVSYTPLLSSVNIDQGTANGVTVSNVNIISGSANGITISNSTITSNATTLTNAVITTATINGGTANGVTESNVTIVSGSANGISLTSTTITTPRIVTALLDSNGNAAVGITATASANNYFTVANAAAGGSPNLSAVGNDTNITVTITPKGSGTVNSATTFSDTYGAVRAVPLSGSDKTSNYALTKADVGRYIGVGSGGSITVPASVFATGDVVSIYNNTAANISMTLNAGTTYLAGNNTTRTSCNVTTRGVATVLFLSGTQCVVAGNAV